MLFECLSVRNKRESHYNLLSRIYMCVCKNPYHYFRRKIHMFWFVYFGLLDLSDLWRSQDFNVSAAAREHNYYGSGSQNVGS